MIFQLLAIEKRAPADIFIFSRSVAPLMSPGREEKTKGEEKVESSKIKEKSFNVAYCMPYLRVY